MFLLELKKKRFRIVLSAILLSLNCEWTDVFGVGISPLIDDPTYWGGFNSGFLDRKNLLKTKIR